MTIVAERAEARVAMVHLEFPRDRATYALAAMNRPRVRARPGARVRIRAAKDLYRCSPHRDPKSPGMLAPIDTIIENFEVIEDDDMRLEYLIELGRALPPMPEALRTEANRVHGCESQVWIDTAVAQGERGPALVLHGFSDSFIVRGFVALMVALYSGKSPQEAARTDGLELFRQLRFGSHVTSKRSNGVRAMADRIHRDAVRLAA